MESVVPATGTAESKKHIELRFNRSATVASVAVKIGDRVKSGQTLASLDPGTFPSQLAQAVAGVAVIQSNLDQKLSGIRSTQKTVLLDSIASAETALASSRTSLENAKNSANASLARSRAAVRSAEVALVNAKTLYGNTLSSAAATASGADQTLANAYSKAEGTIGLSVIAMKNTYSGVDLVLGVDTPSANAAFKNSFDTQLLSTAKNDYLLGKSAFVSTEDSYASFLENKNPGPNEIEAILASAEGSLRATKTVADDTYRMLADAVASTALPSSSLEGFKSSVSSLESSLISSLDGIDAVRASIASAKSAKTSAEASAKTAVDTAESGVNTAEESLNAAQKSLESAIAENRKSVDAAEADVRAKGSALKQLRASYEDAVAPPRLEDIAALRAQLDQASAAADAIRKNMDDLRIVSPSDGVVTAVNIHSGESATSAGPAVELDTGNLRIIANVPEIAIAKIKVGNPATADFDAIAETTMNAHVSEIEPAETVIGGAVDYRTTLLLDQEDVRIKSGMSANIRIVADRSENALSVPASAVFQKEGKSFARVLSGKDVSERDVTVGIKDENSAVQILSGLSEGEEVILSGS